MPILSALKEDISTAVADLTKVYDSVLDSLMKIESQLTGHTQAVSSGDSAGAAALSQTMAEHIQSTIRTINDGGSKLTALKASSDTLASEDEPTSATPATVTTSTATPIAAANESTILPAAGVGAVPAASDADPSAPLAAGTPMVEGEDGVLKPATEAEPEPEPKPEEPVVTTTETHTTETPLHRRVGAS